MVTSTQVVAPVVEKLKSAGVIPAEETQIFTRESLQKRIEEISSIKLKSLLEREAQLHKEIEELSSLRGENRNSRTLSIKETELAGLRVEIAKRGEDLATLSFTIAGEMEHFGQMSVEAMEDSQEDLAKRKAAGDAVAIAEKRLVDAKTQKQVAENDLKSAGDNLVEAKESFIFGRKGKVAKAEAKVDDANYRIQSADSAIEEAETELETARAGIPIVEEQIQVDKRDRIKNASLEETYATITKWVAQAKKILKADIGEYGIRIVETKAAHASAIDLRQKASIRMRDAETKVVKLDADFANLETDREDISDRTDPTYQKLTTEMEQIALELDAAKNEKKLAESGFSDAEIAVKERSTSLMALTSQAELAKNHFNKFVMCEQTAQLIGPNIVVLVKGSTREVLDESLDRGIHKMTVTVFDLGKRATIASTAQLSDLQERKLQVLEIMEEMDAETSEALAEQQSRYADLTQKLREGYAKKGLDVDNMSKLKAAAEIAQRVGGIRPAETGDELY